MSDEEFRARLKRLREAAGLSQDKLGAAAGVTGQAIYMAESGQRFFQRYTAERVAAALNVTPQYLLYGFETTYTGEMPPIEVYLRATHTLDESDIAQIAKIVRALEAEQLRELARERDEDEREEGHG